MKYTPEQVKQARSKAGHTQTQAAETVGKKWRTWQDWELGKRTPDSAAIELYLIKTNHAKK